MGTNGGTERKTFGLLLFTYPSGLPADAFCGLFRITTLLTYQYYYMFIEKGMDMAIYYKMQTIMFS